MCCIYIKKQQKKKEGGMFASIPAGIYKFARGGDFLNC
jgi:hypothetical protein